jgi:cupin fold WbuC family metalloprotein
MTKIIKIKYKHKIVAIIIRAGFSKKGINFITPEDYGFQIAFMQHKKNYLIKPHVHKKQKINLNKLSEALFIISGEMKVDFYDKNKNKLKNKSYIIKKGDFIYLDSDFGHGFKIKKNLKMIEVKQGPYDPKNTKKLIND